MEPELPSSARQRRAFRILERNSLRQLGPENSVLLDDELDHALLMAVDPAGEQAEEEGESGMGRCGQGPGDRYSQEVEVATIRGIRGLGYHAVAYRNIRLAPLKCEK